MSAHELAIVGLAGSSLGTALGVPMVWPKTRQTLDVRLLGIALLLMSGVAALISARLAGLMSASAAVEHAINVLGLFAFPLLVLYTRHASALPITWSSTAWLMVPAAGYLVLLCGRAAMGVDHRVPFAWLLPIVLGFTTAGAVTLWRRHGVSATSTVVPAMWVVAFVVMVNVAQIVRMTFGHISAVRAVVPLMLSAGFLAATALLVWRALSPRSIAVTAVSSPKYERSGLESSAARELLGRIDRALTQDRLFVRAELTLAELAVAVESTPHQVSEVLNRHAGLSFHDLVNRRRVDEVKAQLIDRTNDRFTIEGIGGAAGFGSRSALYAAFRRFEGTTPTAFRESRRGIPPSNISN